MIIIWGLNLDKDLTSYVILGMFLYMSNLFPSLLNGILISLCGYSEFLSELCQSLMKQRVQSAGHTMFSEVVPSFSPLPHHVFLLSAGCKVCDNKCMSWTGGTARGELSLALSVTTLGQRMNHLQLTPGICKGLFHGSPNLQMLKFFV